LFLRPCGGYRVIFMLFCKIGIEKLSVGIEVSHILKSLCMLVLRP